MNNLISWICEDFQNKFLFLCVKKMNLTQHRCDKADVGILSTIKNWMFYASFIFFVSKNKKNAT